MAVRRVQTPEEATGEYTGPLEEDVGNLMVCDNAPLADETLASEDALSTHARNVLQHLVNKLFKQPSFPADGFGRMAELPPPNTRLPRQKPMPEPRPLTRFEKFAKRKGLRTRKKRSKLVWDDQAQAWKRRHGKDRVSRQEDVPVVEAGENEQPGSTDPFTKMERERKQRSQAQKARETRNLQEMHSKGGSKALPSHVSLAAANGPSTSSALPKEPAGSKQKREHLSAQTARVAEATASMGKFDAMQPGEPQSARSRRGKQKQLDPVTVPAKQAENAPDVQRSKKLASKIASGEDIVQADKARKLQQQADEARNRKQKLKRDDGIDAANDDDTDGGSVDAQARKKQKKQGLLQQRQAGKKAAKSAKAAKKQQQPQQSKRSKGASSKGKR